MNKLGITIVKNTGFFSVGFYPDEKTINFSNVIEVIKTVFNEDDTPFHYGESKIDPSEKDYIEYISEYEPEDLE